MIGKQFSQLLPREFIALMERTSLAALENLKVLKIFWLLKTSLTLSIALITNLDLKTMSDSPTTSEATSCLIPRSNKLKNLI